MDKANDLMLFPNHMKRIKERKLEKAHYIELRKYSVRMYKREMIINLIILFVIVSFISVIGVVALWQLF